ncbi:MAG: cysteine desulfurase [Flavobacteriales bacterium]|nr:cysteine desulfurase [Flavobacteriales bacterium]
MTNFQQNINKIRADFPILSRKVYGKPLIYLDNAASSQKPSQVIDTISHYYENEHSNIHRGVHHLSAEATKRYEEARKTVQRFIGAEHSHEIIFTKGTTDAINLVANSFGNKFLNEGDEVIVSTLEHHSNIVPWQMICEARGAMLKVIPINEAGELLIDEFKLLLSDKTKIVAVNHVSNALGTINPIKEIITEAKRRDIPVLIDGAQAVPHMKVDVQELDCDFYAFSSHKMFGPTGVGILYGKEKLLNDIPPYQGGGDMIDKVTFEKTTYNDLPHKFEAGTPNIAGGIGLKAAIDYMNEIGVENIAAAERELLDYATQEITQIESVRLIGTAKEEASVLSFLVKDIHPYDIGTILDRLGVAVRTGHHCTEPLMDRFKIPGTVRASFAFYNTKSEIDVFISALKKAISMLS